MKQFGLDIGANTMKAVWLDQKGNGYLLKASLTVQTPPKGMLSESPLDQEEMAAAIRKLVSDAYISTPFVNIALPENQVYTKVIEMPVLSDKELQSAIYYEAEQYIPVPLPSVTLDKAVLKRPESGQGKMEVLLVAAPTMLIDKYQKILAMAGLTISSVETEILSAVRALVLSDKERPMLIVNIGAINTSIAIVQHGIIVFTYSIPNGGLAISRAIASDFGFSTEQAEEYKKVYGLSDETFGGKLGKSTEPVLNSILVEIKKAISYYNEKYQNDDPISQIILAGGTAKLPGISPYFAKNTGIESVIANPWKMLLEQDVPKDILDNAVDYTIAAGLAMRGEDAK